MTFSHHMSITRWSAPAIAEQIERSYYNSELGWINIFGETWEGIVHALRVLPPRATEKQIFSALPPRMAMHLPWLRCASCTTPATTLINLGHPTSTFMACESCLEEALTSLHPQDPAA